MAAIECGRGHLYDPSIYAACPYCNSSQQAVHFGQPPVGNPGWTAPLQGAPAAGAGWAPPAGGVAVGNDGKTAPIGVPSPQAGVAVSSDGKTLPPKGYQGAKRVDDEDNKTIGLMKKTLGIDPVVGWLVCINGKSKGKDYKLRGQINTIGRSKDMDICLENDETISSENHARLSYSEKNNRFNLIPAESKNIIYLNGEEVFSATNLKAYDLIEFGETKLIFVPLCTNDFDWTKGSRSGGDGDGTV